SARECFGGISDRLHVDALTMHADLPTVNLGFGLWVLGVGLGVLGVRCSALGGDGSLLLGVGVGGGLLGATAASRAARPTSRRTSPLRGGFPRSRLRRSGEVVLVRQDLDRREARDPQLIHVLLLSSRPPTVHSAALAEPRKHMALRVRSGHCRCRFVRAGEHSGTTAGAPRLLPLPVGAPPVALGARRTGAHSG